MCAKRHNGALNQMRPGRRLARGRDWPLVDTLCQPAVEKGHVSF